MFRWFKALLLTGVMAVGTLALTSPADAQVRFYGGFGYGGYRPYYGAYARPYYYRNYYRPYSYSYRPYGYYSYRPYAYYRPYSYSYGYSYRPYSFGWYW